MELKVGSLFSGIGGIDIAFKQAGFKISWAIDNDENCCRTYRHNFVESQLIQKDIRLINPDDLSKVDILIAGFPCQSFSIAGKQKGFSDVRGHLFYEVEKFIKTYSPRIVFLENVPNLIEHDNGKTFNIVHNILSELDYSIRYRVLRASEYGGVPQIRDRVYIVAFRDQIDCDFFSFPEPIELNCSIEDVLQRDCRRHKIYYYAENEDLYKSSKGIVTRKDSIYRVYHDSIKLTQNKMCPTLTASMGIRPNQVPLVVDNYGLRKLTIQECLDFQGFPKEFRFPHTITLKDAYKQIGNSVCVPVVYRIAKQMKEVLTENQNI